MSLHIITVLVVYQKFYKMVSEYKILTLIPKTTIQNNKILVLEYNSV